MNILIGLIPALAWGVLPVAVTKMGGRPSNQILGTTAGTFLVALALFLYARPEMEARVFLLSALSGALWVLGQTGQYYGYARLGVSHTMPISAGLQLIGTSLIGVFVFGEWPSFTSRLIGFIALAVVVLGVSLTALKNNNAGRGGMDKAALLILIFTTTGFLAYSAIPDVVDARGLGTTIFFPQAAGMFCAALLYAVFSGQRAALRQAASWKNMLSGLVFSVAALGYIISAQLNGIATGFVLTQLSVVISTISGIVILKEKKTRFELAATLAGLGLVVAGALTIGFL